MEENRFKKIVEARANERASARIRTFQSGMKKLMESLIIKNMRTPEAKQIFEAYAKDPDDVKAWPGCIWKNEEAAVEKELLATMDEMQKAFLAASKKQDDEFIPVEVEK